MVPAHPGSPGQRAVKLYVCVCVCVGMIEHGFVEASSYTPSRVLSPTLHTVGDFVEVCYHGEKVESSLSPDSQTQAPVQTSSVVLACSTANGSSCSDWQTVEESLSTSCLNSDTLTFIPCESGSVRTETGMSEIVLSDDGLGDATVKCGEESPGVHSAHSKTGITVSDMVTVPPSSETDNGVSNIASIDSRADKPPAVTKTASNGTAM